MKKIDAVALVAGAKRGLGQGWRGVLHGAQTRSDSSRPETQAIRSGPRLVDAALATAANDATQTAQGKRLLSQRETAVLHRLSMGETNKEAARTLQISPSTVRTHVESIFRKLGCSNRTAATRKGLNLGLI